MIQFTGTVNTCLACMRPWVVFPDLSKTNFCLNVVSGISEPHESEVTAQSCVITMAIMHKIIAQNNNNNMWKRLSTAYIPKKQPSENA